VIVTLTTDFGLSDFYVAQMKGALFQQCPQVTLVDGTHDVPPQDVAAGAIAVERAVAGFGPGTVHVAVLDPGVGTDRRLLAVEVGGQVVLLPDNGLVTWAWWRIGNAVAHELSWRPQRGASDTFHGRDILAPAAGLLAGGTPLVALCGPRVESPVLLDLAPAEAGATVGRVIHIDRYDNAMTNVSRDVLASLGSAAHIGIGRHTLGPVRRTYADVPVGHPVALVGSSELLEIAVRNGSVSATLGVRVGDEVRLT